MKINSYYPVLCVDDVKTAATFYQTHFGFEVVFENEWYIHLMMPENNAVNLAFVQNGHASVPERFRKPAQGVLLNFELDDVQTLYEKFRAEGVAILLELRDEPWGQRHFIVADGCGAMVDIIQLIEPSEEFKAQYLVQP